MMDDKAQAWLDGRVQHRLVPGTRFVSGQILCSVGDLATLLREVAEEASREELDFALRAAQSRELRVKALEAEVKRQSLAAGELEAEVERLKGESASVSRTCGHLSDLATWWVGRAEAAEAEVERLKLSMLAHFNEEHLAGDGPEIDRWKREVLRLRGRVEELEFPSLAICERVEKSW